jgi:hypothetical protein
MNPLDPRLDTALNTEPKKSLPRGFVQRVMLQTAARPAYAKSPFRLEFLDLALPVFAIVFVVQIALLAVWLLNQSDPFWLSRIENQLAWFSNNVALELNVAVMLAAGLGFLGLLAVVGLAVTFNGFSSQTRAAVRKY